MKSRKEKKEKEMKSNIKNKKLKGGKIRIVRMLKNRKTSIISQSKSKEFVMGRTLIITIMILLLAGVSGAQELKTDIGMFKKHSFGVGFGIPYGIVGGNFDVNLAPNLDLSMGLGTTIFAGMGYNFGLKYFLTPVDRTFRPRVSAYYGTNAMVAVETSGYYASTQEGESYKGLTLGFGSQWMWGKSKSNGLDLDIMFIATSGLNIDDLKKQGYDVNEPGKVKISIGYRRGF
ncbi:MAG: hypothetical protein GY861_13610 [bacterium]|nr:hypothetical protein [bacterium]